jgi:hypothetical protein
MLRRTKSMFFNEENKEDNSETTIKLCGETHSDSDNDFYDSESSSTGTERESDFYEELFFLTKGIESGDSVSEHADGVTESCPYQDDMIIKRKKKNGCWEYCTELKNIEK